MHLDFNATVSRLSDLTCTMHKEQGTDWSEASLSQTLTLANHLTDSLPLVIRWSLKGSINTSQISEQTT